MGILNNIENRTNGHTEPKPEAVTNEAEPQPDESKPLAVRDEGDAEYVYVFNFVKPSSYWNVVELARKYIAPGEIVDLGAGAGTLGPPLLEAGFSYIGLERSNGGLRLMSERGLKNYPCDLSDLDSLKKIVEENVPLKAFCLIDVLEHLEHPGAILNFLSDYARNNQTPYLIISVPNIGHRDVAYKLLSGRWDLTETGILDKTHLRFFTQPTLLKLLDENGWELVAKNDFKLEQSDQYDPESILHSSTLAGNLLHYLSDTLNPDNQVNQFIWLLKPKGQVTAPTPKPPIKRPLVSMLIRTQGARNDLLTEALYSIYAQDCDDYEIVVCFHSPAANPDKLLHSLRPEARQQEDDRTPKDPQIETFRELQSLIDKLPVQLNQKTRVIISSGVGRSAPLNDLLEAAEGEYLSFLDDDDLLFPRHISVIKKAVEEHGRHTLFQTFAAERQVRVLAEENSANEREFGFDTKTPLEPDKAKGTFPYTVEMIRPTWAEPFNPIIQQYSNRVPITCFAMPRKIVEQTNLRFRSDFDLVEDWEFWMRVTQILKVITLPEITAAINIRTNGTNTVGHEELQPEWQRHHKKRLDLQAERPLVLDGRTARLIYREHLKDLHKLEAIYRDHQHKLKTLQSEQQTFQETEFRNLEKWAHDLETRLQKIQGHPLYRFIGRFIR